MNLQTARLVLALVGVLVWAYAHRAGYDELRWVGIGMLAVAFILRFIRRKPTSPAQG